MEKLTKREMFTMLREVVGRATIAEIVTPEAFEVLDAGLVHELELLTRKHGSGKLTASQRENIALKQKIVQVLNSGEKFRSGDVASELEIAIQKSTALLNQLVNETESVVKVKEGKVTYFATVE